MLTRTHKHLHLSYGRWAASSQQPRLQLPASPEPDSSATQSLDDKSVVGGDSRAPSAGRLQHPQLLGHCTTVPPWHLFQEACSINRFCFCSASSGPDPHQMSHTFRVKKQFPLLAGFLCLLTLFIIAASLSAIVLHKRLCF